MSTGANCTFVEKAKGKWYYELQQYPYGACEEYDTYGPYPTFKAAYTHLSRNHANPGGYSVSALPGCPHDMLVDGYEKGDKSCDRCGKHIPNPAKKLLIQMYSHSPCVFTVADYEQMKKNIEDRAAAGKAEPGDRILVEMLKVNARTYQEAKAASAAS